MEELTQNTNNNDLNIFKEDVLSHIRELENKLTNQILNKESNLNKDYNEFTAKMNSLIENNKEMVSNLVSQKLKIEKIAELESFKNKVDGMLITHEVRIKNSIDEIEKMKTKYDKIVTDNLYVSGFIGNSCQFRNLSEYLSYNISEVSKLKMEREQYKKDMKEIKNKLDATVKNMITLNDNSVKLCNKYTDTKQEEFRKLLETAQTELNQKSMEMRAMIVQFQNESDRKIDNLKKEFDKLLEMKSEFIDLIDNKYKTFEIKHDELDKKATKNDENIEINKNKIENIDDQLKTLEKSIKDLSFQVRNYYCVSNKLAGMLEQLGANPSKSEIAKLLLGIPGNSINNETKPNKTLSISVSPQPKRIINKNVNLDLLKLALDDSILLKNNNNNTNINNNNNKKRMTQSVINFSTKNSGFNKIAIKKLNFTDDNSDSESSSIYIINENTKKNAENLKENLRPIIKSNLKQSKNGNNTIKQSIKENAKVNFKENIKEAPKQSNLKSIKEAPKEKIKEVAKENKKEVPEENKKEVVKENKKDAPEESKKEAPKEIIKETDKENVKEESKENIKEKNSGREKISSKKSEINSMLKYKAQALPLLTLGNKEENKREDIKIVNLSSASIDKFNNEKNKNKNNLIKVISNDNNKIKHNYQKSIMKRIDLELEQDQQACRIVALSLPKANIIQLPTNNIIKKKNGINNNGKYDVVNSLINDYRAKLFSKAHSPESKFDVTNEILDIPKKVSQAFGRTTYTFYFKKDAIDCAIANRNINNFGYNGPKKSYKLNNNKRIGTGIMNRLNNNDL